MSISKSITGVMLLALVASTGVLTGCKDSPTNNNSTESTVALEAELADAAVFSSTDRKNASLATGGETCDSLKVTRVRILISRLKLKHDDDDCYCRGEVKTGPFVLQVDAQGPRVFTHAVIPPGHYRKGKLEFHRFSSSEIGRYLNDTLFRDFVDEGRYTVIIDGAVYVNGQQKNFEYKSDVTLNLNFDFENEFACNAGSSNTLVLVVDAGKIFRHRAARLICDPRDSKNKKDIDDAINGCFRMKKRA